MPLDRAPGTPQEWLDRARGKLAFARQPLPKGGCLEDLCFMVHQTAELAIKAVFQHRDVRFACTHDLAKLLRDLKAQGVVPPREVGDAVELTVYATRMRYPGSAGFVTQEDYAVALGTAEAVVAWAESIIEG